MQIQLLAQLLSKLLEDDAAATQGVLLDFMSMHQPERSDDETRHAMLLLRLLRLIPLLQLILLLPLPP